MAVTSQDVANQAIELLGDDQPFVTGQAPNFDNSAAGKALSKLYAPCVATVQRQFGWDASRNAVALTLSGNTPPMPGWLYEYVYPTNGIEVWQLTPTAAAITDPNNPLPVNWDVGNNQVGGIQTKVIWSNQASAQAIYNNNPTEAVWDALFREEVARLLASELAMALAGKPDTSQNLLETAGTFGSLAEGRPD
jgi:hypothetical protein